MSTKQLFKLANKFEAKLNKFSGENPQTLQANIESIQFLRGAAGKIYNMLTRITGNANSEFNEKFKPVLKFCNDLYRKALGQSLKLSTAESLKESIFSAYQYYDAYLGSSFSFKQSKNYNQESADLLDRLHKKFLENYNNYIPKAILSPTISAKFIDSLIKMMNFELGVEVLQTDPKLKTLLSQLVQLSKSDLYLHKVMFLSESLTENINDMVLNIIHKYKDYFDFIFRQEGDKESKLPGTQLFSAPKEKNPESVKSETMVTRPSVKP